MPTGNSRPYEGWPKKTMILPQNHERFSLINHLKTHVFLTKKLMICVRSWDEPGGVASPMPQQGPIFFWDIGEMNTAGTPYFFCLLSATFMYSELCIVNKKHVLMYYGIMCLKVPQVTISSRKNVSESRRIEVKASEDKTLLGANISIGNIDLTRIRLHSLLLEDIYERACGISDVEDFKFNVLKISAS